MRKICNKLSYLASIAITTVSVKCGDIFGAADAAASATKTKIDGAISSIFPLAIGLIVLALLFVRDTKKVHMTLILLLACVAGYVGWKWAINGTITATIQSIFGV